MLCVRTMDSCSAILKKKKKKRNPVTFEIADGVKGIMFNEIRQTQKN